MKIDIDRVEIVTPDTNIGDLVLFHPETAELLFSSVCTVSAARHRELKLSAKRQMLTELMLKTS